MKKLIAVVASLCLAASMFAGGAKDSSQDEKVLDVYSIMPEKYATQVFAQFEKDTGIKVNFVRLSSGEALSRIIAEKDNPQVDCLWGGPSDTYDAGVKEGVFQKYKPADYDKIPENYHSTDQYWTGIGIIPLCFLTNTDFLKKNNLQAPTSWYDLTTPAYKNGLQMADARTSGTATERIYALVKAYGEDKAFAYQKDLNKNVQLYTKSGAGGAQPVSNGQAASGIFYLVDALDLVNQGYPIVVSYPKEGVTYGVEATGILTNCKHLKAAQKLQDWAASKALGEFMMANKICYIPTRPDVKVEDPALDMKKIKFLDAPSAWKGEVRKPYIERWVKEVIEQ